MADADGICVVATQPLPEVVDGCYRLRFTGQARNGKTTAKRTSLARRGDLRQDLRISKLCLLAELVRYNDI